MKTILIILLISICLPVLAQDYFVIVKKNDNQSFRYPPSVKIFISGENIQKRKIEKDEASTFTGNYTLEIEVPWSKKPEIIKSNGGTLEIFVLPQNARESKENSSYKTQPVNTLIDHSKQENAKPQFIKKKITKSDQIKGYNNLSIQFSNDLIFRYEDGKVNAWQKGKSLTVTNKYLVQTPEGLLKISFDPKSGETWWVFEL